MATFKGTKSFKNCTLDKEEGILVEYKKDATIVHSIDKLLQELADAGSFDLTYTTTTEDMDTVVESTTEEQEVFTYDE